MHKDKAWARGPMPPTLDEALDFMATEYDITMAAADLFYSNPFTSFDESNSTGGWVGTETIDGASCHHLAFEAKVINWAIWVADTAQALPCRMKITYKNEAGSPATVLTFSKWNLAPTFTAETFESKIDPAYERLYMVRAPTAEPVPVAANTTPAAPVAPAPKQ